MTKVDSANKTATTAVAQEHIQPTQTPGTTPAAGATTTSIPATPVLSMAAPTRLVDDYHTRLSTVKKFEERKNRFLQAWEQRPAAGKQNVVNVTRDFLRQIYSLGTDGVKATTLDNHPVNLATLTAEEAWHAQHQFEHMYNAVKTAKSAGEYLRNHRLQQEEGRKQAIAVASTGIKA